jgi:hypothetical protein
MGALPLADALLFLGVCIAGGMVSSNSKPWSSSKCSKITEEEDTKLLQTDI